MLAIYRDGSAHINPAIIWQPYWDGVFMFVWVRACGTSSCVSPKNRLLFAHRRRRRRRRRHDFERVFYYLFDDVQSASASSGGKGVRASGERQREGASERASEPMLWEIS